MLHKKNLHYILIEKYLNIFIIYKKKEESNYLKRLSLLIYNNSIKLTN